VINLEEPTQPNPTMPESPRQPIAERPKRKPYKKVISIILIGLVLCSSLGAQGFFYWDLNNKYKNLQFEHAILQSIHSQLSDDYQNLQQNYRNLNAKYNDLDATYQHLFTDYDTLSYVFNEPLTDSRVPTIEELHQWLSEDKTNEIQYDYPKFTCGDFAVMLSQHAKLKKWDMGIVAVFGYDKNYEPYGHAFNAIITSQGLRYIEPQNDYFWSYKDGLPIREYRWNQIGRDRTNIYVEICKIIVLYE